jgi:hypothetical protein
MGLAIPDLPAMRKPMWWQAGLFRDLSKKMHKCFNLGDAGTGPAN